MWLISNLFWLFQMHGDGGEQEGGRDDAGGRGRLQGWKRIRAHSHHVRGAVVLGNVLLYIVVLFVVCLLSRCTTWAQTRCQGSRTTTQWRWWRSATTRASWSTSRYHNDNNNDYNDSNNNKDDNNNHDLLEEEKQLPHWAGSGCRLDYSNVCNFYTIIISLI